MVALERPDLSCGHQSGLTQQCGKCWRWCCPGCYSPWMALTCAACRAEAEHGGPPTVELDLAALERLLKDARPSS